MKEQVEVSKVCSKCHVEQTVACFYPDRTKAIGYGGWCKACLKKHRKKWTRPIRLEACKKCGREDKGAGERANLCQECFLAWVDWLRPVFTERRMEHHLVMRQEERDQEWEKFLHG